SAGGDPRPTLVVRPTPAHRQGRSLFRPNAAGIAAVLALWSAGRKRPVGDAVRVAPDRLIDPTGIGPRPAMGGREPRGRRSWRASGASSPTNSHGPGRGGDRSRTSNDPAA